MKESPLVPVTVQLAVLAEFQESLVVFPLMTTAGEAESAAVGEGTPLHTPIDAAVLACLDSLMGAAVEEIVALAVRKRGALIFKDALAPLLDEALGAAAPYADAVLERVAHGAALEDAGGALLHVPDGAGGEDAGAVLVYVSDGA